MRNVMKVIATFVLFTQFMVCVGAAQDVKVFIYDSSGNSATASISNGNLYLQDSKGNAAFGTIRNGNLFVQGSNGETVIGTIRDGNVFLIDNKGTTTGTIRDGHVFLNHSDGSTTFGNYSPNGNLSVNTTDAPPTVQQDHAREDAESERIRQQKQSEYDAGYGLGYGIGTVVHDRLTLHSINKACKKGAGKVSLANGGVVDCVRWNAGERAITYPPSPSVARQNAEMAAIQRDIVRLKAETAAMNLGTMDIDRRTINTEREAAREGIFHSGEQNWQWAFRDWEDIRNRYCEAAPSGHYIDLDNTSTTCDAPHSTEAEQLERLNRELAAAVMESKRDLINTFKGTPGASALIESARKDWAQAQETFCRAAPEGTYIDTDGKEETCPP